MSDTNIYRRRAQQLRRARGRRSGRTGENPVLIRLVICGAAFVLLVAAKLLFPEAVGQLADSARQLIGRDADFKEAFAAVGRAVSGEAGVGDSLQDAYAAVFNASLQPEEEPAAEEEAPQPPEDPAGPADAAVQPADSGTRLLRHTFLPLPEADKAVMREVIILPEAASPAVLPAGDAAEDAAEDGGTEDAPEEDSGETAAAMSYTMAPLPENASLEQRNLGFEHCTPVQGRLSSTFGWREHPVEGGNRFHYGVDLAAESGTDVLAFADGEVYASGESSTLGNYIMLRHEGGYITLYAHCSRITAAGGRVSMGEKIAEVGATGLVTGAHLHFELHDGELYLNPIYYVAVG
ncbi:MAG: M23 family metallopeptidase [Oscillibacter sp.]|nr:M23 family metallopeptidase [Oscillibacter sp.]